MRMADDNNKRRMHDEWNWGGDRDISMVISWMKLHIYSITIYQSFSMKYEESFREKRENLLWYWRLDIISRKWTYGIFSN